MAKTTAAGGRGRSERPRQPLPPQQGGQKTGARRFIRESWGELRKVQWPTRQQVLQGTLVVGIVTIFFAVYLSLIDVLMAKAVHELDKWLT